MANKRMFSLEVVSSDAFSNMPLSAQALYFHLGMLTDDDGFVVSPKRTQRAIGAADDDMRILVAKGFLIPFDSGVTVVTHHSMNNSLRNNRHKPTKCQDELAQLKMLPTGAYCLKGEGDLLIDVPVPTSCQPADNQMATKCRPNITEQNVTQPNLTEPSSEDMSGAAAPIVSEVVDYLNAVTGSSFRAVSKTTSGLIKARVNEGYDLEDFKRVIDVKASQWKDDPSMCGYLRPQTLFGPKFESYLNEKAVKNNDYSEYDCEPRRASPCE